jgi:pimeloyl-ACP methyl ester carboxylesterase
LSGSGDRLALEVIDKGRCSPLHPVPLLFVHGAWHGAWCWDEHFLDFFCNRGFHAVALNLRGHGASPSAKPLYACSIADYVDDVRSVADSLPSRPVVIGHSMGGFVVQKYLESRAAPAAVLVASAPAAGTRGSVLRTIRRHPWLSVKAAATATLSPVLVREMLFSPETPTARVAHYVGRIQQESARALFLDLLLDLPSPGSVSTPMLVLGAELDGSFTRGEVRATARAYNTEAEFFPDMGHDMMLETGWAAVAQRIHTWLGAHGL